LVKWIFGEALNNRYPQLRRVFAGFGQLQQVTSEYFDQHPFGAGIGCSPPVAAAKRRNVNSQRR